MRNTTVLYLLIFALAACNTSKDQSNDTDILKANELLGRRYFEEVWNNGNTALLDTLLAPGYINHTPSIPATPGPAGLKPIVKAIRRGFPDLHYQIEELIATPDFVTMRVTMTGTQTDTLFDIPPTGKSIKITQINIEKIKNGRIVEHWRVTDELTMMKQLSVVK
jgi:steroid delta-isomerase-like uncharacterized protein